MTGRAPGPRRRRWIVTASLMATGLAALVDGAAVAGERDLREARAELEKAAASGDAAAIAKAAARLAHAEPPRGALELAADLGHRERRVALAARDELARSGDPRVARALGERLAGIRET